MAEEALKPSEWESLFDWIEKLAGAKMPHWVTLPIAGILLLALIISMALVVIAGVAKIQELWLEKIAPRLFKPEQKQRARSRRLFAQHLAREIAGINAGENWRDDEFTELEAEVEAEGRRRSWLPFHRPRGIRRERSLTVALSRSTERLVLVEGEPGSGKSVALRHVGLTLAARASGAQRLDTVLPVYVNLKSLRRGTAAVDRDLIRSHVLQSLNRFRDRFVDEFVAANFDEGVRSGTWFFLFDSFDEIPDVLSSTEADAVIALYTQAIADFLGGLNACRAVVASRFYRGPEAQGWRRFRILPLSTERQRELIEKALLVQSSLVRNALGDLQNAGPDIRDMAANPLLLGLLCEHVRLGNKFPADAFDVYAKYVGSRLKRDAVRVGERYGIQNERVHEIARDAAFSITADRDIGLTPRRSELWAAMQRQGFRHPRHLVSKALDALEYMKLARQGGNEGERDPQFTFAHRRFQEYFATSLAVADPGRVSPRDLLLDARWRETAVVVCQTGREAETAPLLSEAAGLLEAALENVESLYGTGGTNEPGFSWPPGIIHVLGILQDGFPGRAELLPDRLRETAYLILWSACRFGDFLDRKFALEVAGSLRESDLTALLRSALALDSRVMNEVIYRQVARLRVPPPDLMTALRTALLRLAVESRSGLKQTAMSAFVRRVPQAPELAQAALLALWLAPIANLLAAASALPWIPILAPWQVVVCGALFVALSTFHMKNLFTWLGPAGAVARWLIAFISSLVPPSQLESVVLHDFLRYHSASIWRHSGILTYWVLADVFLCYFAAWPFSTTFEVRSGRYLRPFHWPVIPILSLWQSTGFLREIRNVWILPACCVPAAAFLYAISNFPVATALFGLSCVLVGGIALAIALSINIVGIARYACDSHRMRRSVDAGSGGIAPGMVSALYRSLRTEYGRAVLLDQVEARGVAGVDKETLDALRDLALSIDGEIDRRTKRVPGPALRSIFRSLDWTSRKQHLMSQRDSVYLVLEASRRAGITEPTS